MRLPTNATAEELERSAYIRGDLEKANLYQRIEEAEESLQNYEITEKKYEYVDD